MAIEIIRRRDALAQGRVRYFTGKPCKHGHITERSSSDGRCVECNRAWANRWYSENTERAKSSVKKWQNENRHRALTYKKRWREENPDRVRVWRRLNQSHRRARKINAGGSHTHEQILDLFKKQKGRCAGCFCSIKYGWHNDHITALSKGGSNDISNIQLLCQPCNQEKFNKDPILWAQQSGRLL